MSGAITATAVAVGLTVTEMFTVVAVTGAVLGAVGAATGVKELQYAGMALGVVGGVGGIASGLGAFAEAGLATGLEGGGGLAEGLGSAGTSGLGSAGAAGIEAVPAPLDLQGMPISYEAPVSGVNYDIISSVSGNLNQPASALPPTLEGAASPNVTPSAVADSPVVAQGQGGGTLGSYDSPYDPGAQEAQFRPAPSAAGGQTPVNTPPSAPVNGAPRVPGVEAPGLAPGGSPLPSGPPVGIESGAPLQSVKLPDAAILGPGSPVNSAGFSSGPGAVTIRLGSAASSSSPFGNIMSFIGQPGVAPLMGMALVGGSSFLSGALSPTTPAHVELMKAQAAANLAAANLYKTNAQLSQTQQDNAASGLPTASRRPPGLINRAA